MAYLYLVRHGRAAARWDEHEDPSLAEEGHAQARIVARRLAPLGPLPLYTSPLLRCQETAVPLAAAWHLNPQILDCVRELPSPHHLDLTARGAWMKEAVSGSWSDVLAREDALLRPWRERLLKGLAALGQDTVVFSHFVAINVAVGHATGSNDVICFRPDNASITILESDGSALKLVELGHEAETEITTG